MTETLTHRERLLRTLRHQPVDRVPDLEFGAWVQTIDRWSQEGLDVHSCNGLGRPQNYLEHYFGTDDDEYGPGLPIYVGLLPEFEETVIEERGQKQIVQDKDGAIAEQLKREFGASIPRYIRHAIVTRADWERVRDERLNPNNPDRAPSHLNAWARRLRQADYPITISVGSLYGKIRNWMGVERLSLMLYDDPALIEEMMEHLTQLALSTLQKLADAGIKVDRADWWEDMCYNSGSLISPRMFAKLMMPRYKRITDFLRRELGCEFNQLDCDGNIHQLVLLWLESGINVMYPIEVAHTNPHRLGDQLGTRGALRGGFDKRALIANPSAIDAEFERLRPLIARGGFIPHTDHQVPPDVSFENYLYYRRKKCELIGKPWREPGVRHRDHLRNWRLLGPFDNLANTGFHTPLPPEAVASGPVIGKHGQTLEWKTYQATAVAGYVDLAEAITREPWCVAYAACDLYSSEAREVWLEMGSDDGLQVWLNGERIWCKDAFRVAAPGQDLIPVRLHAGKNPLLLKIGQAEGEWGFHCRVSNDRGQSLDMGV